MNTASHPLFDIRLYRGRLKRAEKLGRADFLLRHAAADLEERLSVILRQFDVAADIGTPSDVFFKTVMHSHSVKEFKWISPHDLPDSELDPIQLEAQHYALIVSAFALHCVNDLPGALIQIRRALRPDGLFLAAIPGGKTLHELRTVLQTAESELAGGVSPRVFPFADVRDCGSLLQRAGFTLPVTDSEILTVRYPDLFALMHDLRAMGATNILQSRLKYPTKRSVFTRAAELYNKQFSDGDGRIRASFELIWVSGWAAHESQQKPLKPGSAKQKLVNFL